MEAVETTTSGAVPTAAKADVPTTDRKPADGDVIAFCEGADKSTETKWFACVNTFFNRPNGEEGKIDWLCVTPEALEKAENDPFKVEYVGAATYKNQPPKRVISLPDPPPTAQA